MRMRNSKKPRNQPAKPPTKSTERVLAISLDSLPARIREAAFGTGQTFEEGLRAQMSRWCSPEQLDSIVRQALDSTAVEVAAGRLTPIISNRGVVGYHPNTAAQAEGGR